MILHSKQQNEEKTLSKPIRDYMSQKFLLNNKYLDELRCFEYEETIIDRQLLRILIYHPRLAKSKHVSLRSYEDLKRHRDLVIYEGYKDDGRGSLYIEGKRKI